MKKVLVVDDEFNIRDLLKEFLVSNNIKVKTAANGEEALEILNNFKPDLAIVDIQMAVMDGIEFSKKVLSDKPAFPIVMITGHIKKYNLNEILSLGVKEVIGKPLDLRTFLNTVNDYMN